MRKHLSNDQRRLVHEIIAKYWIPDPNYVKKPTKKVPYPDPNKKYGRYQKDITDETIAEEIKALDPDANANVNEIKVAGYRKNCKEFGEIAVRCSPNLSIKKQLERKSKEVEEKSKEVEELTAERDSLQNELFEIRQGNSDLSSPAQAAKISQLNDQLEKANARIAELEKELAGQKEAFDRDIDEINTLKDEVTKKDQIISDLTAERTALEAKAFNVVTREEYDSLISENKFLRGVLDQSLGEIAQRAVYIGTELTHFEETRKKIFAALEKKFPRAEVKVGPVEDGPKLPGYRATTGDLQILEKDVEAARQKHH